MVHNLSTLKTKILANPHRPIIHHLNGDTSWLLQLPRPIKDPHTHRHYYNILIDPWLGNSQIDYYTWFSEQWHNTDPSCKDIAAVEDLLFDIEKLLTSNEAPENGEAAQHPIDLVLISFEFTDHAHFQTLTQLPPSTPVLATTNAASLIRSWKHFDKVFTIPQSSPRAFKPSFPLKRQLPLPEWLHVERVMAGMTDVTTLHSALCITFSMHSPTADTGVANGQNKSPAETIIYTPHGSPASILRPLLSARPPIKPLALMHGLATITVMAGNVNLGAKNAVQVQKMLKAKYWMPTHDEDKGKKGLVAATMRKRTPTAEELGAKEMGFFEVGNGEGIVLI